jgi:transcriptional regulator with XRE-family HTH domain
MAVQHLPNYLRVARKRAGLSQAEVAYLLGCRSGAKVSRYERFARTPKLDTALAYELLFGSPVAELFLGVTEEVSRQTRQRARRLERRLGKHAHDRAFARKLATLRHLAKSTGKDLVYEPINER